MDMDVNDVKETFSNLREVVHKKVVGKDDVIDYIFIGLMTEGHVLLEGVPGIAKTYITNTIAEVLSCDFKRVQFTPDLLPSDILGTMILDKKTNSFKIKKGPIFTNFLLADEINRAPPKTQSALLEAMQEKQVTIDVNTYPLSFPFIVVATQNPIEMEGTYPLPEAQLDRFLFKVDVTYPNYDEEIEIIKLKKKDEVKLKPILTVKKLGTLKNLIEKNVEINEDIIKYIVEIVRATRTHESVLYGASPRASIAFLRAGRVKAAIEGRDYVIPDDIKNLAYSVLNHRIILKPEAVVEGITKENIISDILKSVSVPK